MVPDCATISRPQSAGAWTEMVRGSGQTANYGTMCIQLRKAPVRRRDGTYPQPVKSPCADVSVHRGMHISGQRQVVALLPPVWRADLPQLIACVSLVRWNMLGATRPWTNQHARKQKRHWLPLPQSCYYATASAA